ncbi:phosphoglucosamine mutase [Candidatus Marinamargulisbacteria bacterium SCGC AG-439-L15]|nr:phosphoglucosamine mutase [Candidatus Marinamargulisbacteria bacterium SCGC AG-439-L15]
MSSLIMTPSGVRGLVGENFDPEIALRIAKAFGTYVEQGSVIVCGDTRESYDIYKSAVISGLLATGVDVIDIGQAPTPTCQQMIRHHCASGGIVITASHNPIEWNGIKLMGSAGSFLNDSDYQSFKTIYDSNEFPLSTWSDVGKYFSDTHAIEKHVDKILSAINTMPIQKADLKVLIDTNNGTGCLADPILLDKLGVSYDILNEDPTKPFAHNPEPNESNLSELIQEMKSGNYDIGFAQDADADRLVIVDENGRFIGEDYSLGFCVDHILSISDPSEAPVVVNLSTSSLIERIAQRHNTTTTYTKIGETHVTQALRETGSIVGGEGNGGVIYPKIGWGRDSLIGIVIALSHLAAKKQTVSRIIQEYPEYYMARDKFTVNNQKDVTSFLSKVDKHFPSEKKDTQDGIKVYLNNSWVHVRPSNTEPIIRVFAEAGSTEEAEKLVKKVAAL